MLKFEHEIPLQLNSSFRNQDEAAIEIKAFYDRFRRTGSLSDPLQTNLSPIRMDAFLPLYESADRAAQTKINHDKISGEGEKMYVTALRIGFGLDESFKMDLFYEPIFIYRSSETENGAFQGKIYPLEEVEQHLYIPADNVFKPQKSDFWKRSVDSYRNNIVIRRFRSGRSFWPFYLRDDWKGDTKTVIIPFQELFKLYEINFEDVDPDFTYHKWIAPFNGSVLIDYSSTVIGGIVNRNRHKHTLLFGAEDMGTESTKNLKFLFPQPPEPDDLANFAHLCPPSCGTISLIEDETKA